MGESLIFTRPSFSDTLNAVFLEDQNSCWPQLDFRSPAPVGWKWNTNACILVMGQVSEIRAFYSLLTRDTIKQRTLIQNDQNSLKITFLSNWLKVSIYIFHFDFGYLSERWKTDFQIPTWHITNAHTDDKRHNLFK